MMSFCGIEFGSISSSFLLLPSVQFSSNGAKLDNAVCHVSVPIFFCLNVIGSWRLLLFIYAMLSSLVLALSTVC
jgi:hypothetical protein